MSTKEQETLKPTTMSFEIPYHGDSVSQFAVRFDKKYEFEGLESIEFESINKISFPADKIDWIIECLNKIKSECLEG